jgi:pilus assembly protein CpaF
MRAIQANWLSDLNPEPNRCDLFPALQLVLEEARRRVAGVQRGSQEAVVGKKLDSIVLEVAANLGLELNSRERDQIIDLLEADREGFGIIQPLVDDPSVTDILISSYNNIVVQRNRRNLRTNLSFSCSDEYEAFVERILLKSNSSYSTKTPIADGMLESFARIHAVHKSICSGGPYLTIRLNRFSTIGPEMLVESGFAPEEIFRYLEDCMRRGLSVLLVGEVGTGKTTLARALGNCIPNDESVLVIEDTPEIRLDLPHVRYLHTRVENSEGAGKVSPSECIRAGMRMAMNRIIFGEIRDAEAAESFVDCCSSGHPGISTIHGRSVSDSLTRMMLFLGRAQPNVSREVLMQQVATAVQVVVHVGMCRLSDKRRILEVREVSGIADDAIRQRTLFSYLDCSKGPGWRVVSPTSMFEVSARVAEQLASLPDNIYVSENQWSAQ